MESDVIHLTINTTYFLTILGTAIYGAWYFAARLSKIETILHSVQKTVNDLREEREKGRLEAKKDHRELLDLIYKIK